MTINDRFKDAVWAKNPQDVSILIGGVGGIGSWTALLLSRIGYKLNLVDMDMFETHNMGGQFVSKNQIGIMKVAAVKELCKAFSDNRFINVASRNIEDLPVKHKIVIAAFDNMAARKILFEKWLEYNKENRNLDALFIDGRLGFEHFQIYCVTPNKTVAYRESLFEDNEVEDAVCTLKQTSHMAAMIASNITSFVVNHNTNLSEDNSARTVPFYYEYNSPLHMHEEIL